MSGALNETEFFQIEFKTKNEIGRDDSEKSLLELFVKLNINYQVDLNSIEYVILKKNDFVQKVKLNFLNDESAYFFWDKVKNDMKPDFFDDFKMTNKGSPNGYIEIEKSGDEAICFVEDYDSMDEQLFKKEKLFNDSNLNNIQDISHYGNVEKSLFNQSSLKTNEYPTLEKKLLNDQDLNDIKENESNLVETKNNAIELYSCQNLEKQDLEILLIYLENFKACGGGDISTYQLENQKRILTVTYENNDAKKRVLERKKLNFLNYKLFVSEPLELNKLELESKQFLLNNISKSIDDSIVQLFIENLITSENSDNDVVAFTRSSFFDDTYSIQCKSAIEFDSLLKRLKRRPTLNGKEIGLMQAYRTNCVLVKKFDKNLVPISYELIELYFSNRKRSGTDCYVSIRDYKTFLLMIYDNQETVEQVLSKKHSISNQEFILEKLLNIEQLNQESSFHLNGNSTELIEVKSENVEGQIKQMATSIESGKSIFLHDTKSAMSDTGLIQKIPLTITIKSNEEAYLRLLFLREELYFPRFKNDLEALDAQVSKNIVLDNFYEIKIEKKSDERILNEDEWLSNINGYIKQYFSLFDSENFQITNIEPILKTLANMNVYVDKINDSIYEISGLRDEVAQVKTLLAQMEEQIIEEEITGLKLFQVRILFVSKYIMKMREIYGKLKITIDPRNRRVHFKGTYAQISEAKKQLNDILDRITLTTLPADDALIKLVQLKEIDVVNWLKKKEILVTIEADQEEKLIYIYATDPKELDLCKKALTLGEVNRVEIGLNLFENMNLDVNLLKFATKFTDKEATVVVVDDSKLTICGLNNQIIDRIYLEFIGLL